MHLGIELVQLGGVGGDVLSVGVQHEIERVHICIEVGGLATLHLFVVLDVLSVFEVEVERGSETTQ